MVAGISAVVSATDYGVNGQNKVTVFEVTPAGIGQIGTGTLGIIKDGGGYTITPMMRVKMSRLDSSNRQNPRLLQGLASYIETTQPAGTNRKDWNIRIQDVNLVGTAIGTPLTFAYPAVTQTYGDHIADIVTAVQNAGGAPTENIDAISEVVPDPGLGAFAMPAMEGGHSLNWYIDQINLKVFELSSGAYNMAYYYGSYDDVGSTTVFGGVVLFAYDSLLLPAAGATYNITPGGGERGIRAGTFKRVFDATTLYVRRQASYNTGSVTGYNATANTDYPCPFSALGWWKDPDKYDVATAAEAQALIDADIAANSNALETISFEADGYIHMPGEVIAVTNPLEALVNEKYRVIRTRVIFKSKIHQYPLTEITAGLLPRGLGRGGNRVATRPVLRDTVPPERPASVPTVTTNKYIGGTGDGPGVTRVEITSVNSISTDIGAHRLRYKINGNRAIYSDWITATGTGPGTSTTFPPKEVPSGSSIRVDVQARDTSYNEQPTYGPYTDFTASVGTNERPGGFEEEDTWDRDGGGAGINGWYRSALSGATTAARNTTVVYFGKVSLQQTVTNNVGEFIEYEGNRIYVQPGRLWEVMIARRNVFGTGTAAFLMRFYDKTDTLISTATLWSSTPGTSFVEIPNANRIVTPPATTVYMVPVLRYTSTGSVDQVLWSIDITRWQPLKTAESLHIGTDLAAGRLHTLYDNSNPRVEKADLYYSSASSTYVFTGRSSIGMLYKDGYGNQISQNSTDTSYISIGDHIFAGRLRPLTVAKSSTFTADRANTTYLCSGTITANLPTAVGYEGAWYEIINTGTGVITIDPNSSQKIGTRTTWLLYRDGSILIVSDGTDWQVRGGHNHNKGTALPTTGLYDGLTYDYLINGVNVPVRYDGTRWLGPETPIALHNYIGGPPFSGDSEVLATSLRNDLALYVTRFTVSYYTGGGVDGSNYWDLYLRCLTSGISFNDIVYIRTTDNNWFKEPDKVPADMSNNPCNATDIWLQLFAKKTGSPNAIYIQAQVHGCYVYT